MPAVTLTPEDLEPFADIDVAKASAMIDDAVAMAARVAPCILEPEFEHDAAAKAILRGAVLRWNEAGQGAVTQRGAGPFQESIDTRTVRKTMFWPSEIADLQRLCAEQGSGGAFAVDTVPIRAEVHAETCDLRFGADQCSCGAVLAGFPLWGV
jgi:hypothetical protein